MEKLRNDWITDGLVDFEYKKYILLAYLQHVKENFDYSRLYPFMSELVFHYQNLMQVRANKTLLYENFPQTISKADFSKLRLNYKKIIEDDQVMAEIEQILEYAIPKMKATIEEGKELYEFVESNLELNPIGVEPLYNKEGYLFLAKDKDQEIKIFQYQVTVFENSSETYRGVSAEYKTTEIRSISNTYEQIKVRLARKNKSLPNPATFLVFSKLSFPLSETLLPIAKRLLVKSIG